MSAWFQHSSLLIICQTHSLRGGVSPSIPYFSMSFKLQKIIFWSNWRHNTCKYVSTNYKVHACILHPSLCKQGRSSRGIHQQVTWSSNPHSVSPSFRHLAIAPSLPHQLIVRRQTSSRKDVPPPSVPTTIRGRTSTCMQRGWEKREGGLRCFNMDLSIERKVTPTW
jgi:hypothetical protein